MKSAQLFNFKNCKFYLILFIFLYKKIFCINADTTLSYEFKNQNLKTALVQIIENYNLSIIFPDKTINTLITSKCYQCSEKIAFDSLLFKTKYKWTKVNSQYTIYEANLNYNISGQIIDKITGEPIAYANVYIPNLKTGDVTEYDGSFSISSINIPNCNIVISYIGYESKIIPLFFPKDNGTIKKISLNPKIIMSSKVSIFGSNNEFIETSQISGQIAFSPRFISSLPNLGETDIFRSLQLLPGIQLGLGGTSELYIKGGEPQHNLILLDGMPIYNTNHIYGFMSGINSNAIKDIQIFNGEIPAEYGGRINSIINLTSKKGNNQRVRGEFNSNLISNSYSIESPIFSRVNFILNHRKSNKSKYKSSLYKSIYDFTTINDEFNLIEKSSDNSKSKVSTFDPESYFSDIINRISFLINPKHNISLTNLYSIDSTKENRLFFNLESILGNDSTQIIKTIKKENIGLSTNLSSNWNSKFNTHLIFSKSDLINFQNTTQYLLKFKNEPSQISFAKTKSEFIDNFIKINLTYRGKSKTKIGLEQSNYKISTLESNFEGLANNNSSYKKNTSINSFYIQNNSFSKYKININTGFRINYLNETKKYYKSPRISLKYNFKPHISYEVAFGKQYQFIHYIPKINLNNKKETYLVISSKLIPEISSLNFHTGFNFKNKNYIIKSSGYYRSQKNLFQNLDIYLINKLEKSLPDSNLFSKGNSKSTGIETLIRKKNGYLTGWVSYHFNQTILNFPDLNNGLNFFSDHDKTHEFKFVLFTKVKSLNLTSTWVFSSGRVYTDSENIFINPGYQIFISDKKNEKRLPPIHHLDISLSKKWNLKKVFIQTGISIYNLYNKKNISHKQYNPYFNQLKTQDIAMFGITPTGFIKIGF